MKFKFGRFNDALFLENINKLRINIIHKFLE